jgi:hypothetical protein
MKTLSDYSLNKEFDSFINEGLLKNLIGFFNKIFRKSNKEKIKIVNDNNLKKSKEFKLDELESDSFKTIVSDKKIGFYLLNKILKDKKNLIYNQEKKINYSPKFLTFFYKEDKYINYIGIIGYDPNISIIDNYLTLYLIESAVNIENYVETNKKIIEYFIKDVDKKYKGFVIKPIDVILTNVIKKMGFKPLNTDREIYMYDF